MPLLSKVHCICRKESGRRGSNSRPLAWKANALSTELLPHCTKSAKLFALLLVGRDGFEPPKVKTSRFTVCPIWPLWYLPKVDWRKSLSRWRDSNPRPADYKSAALANWATSAYIHQSRCKVSEKIWIYKIFLQFFLFFFKELDFHPSSDAL